MATAEAALTTSKWAEVKYQAVSSDMCIARGGHSVAHVGGDFAGDEGLLVIFGGADAFGVTSNQLRLVDLASGETVALDFPNQPDTAPAPRCSHALVVKSTTAAVATLVLYGGVSYLPEYTIYADAWLLVLTQTSGEGALKSRVGAAWSLITRDALPGPRHSFAFCKPSPDLLLVACGSVRPPNAPNGPCDGGLFLLDLVSLQWADHTSAASGSIPQCEMATAAAVGDGVVLLSGGHSAFVDENGELAQALCTKVLRLTISVGDAAPSVTADVVGDGVEYTRVAHTAIGLPMRRLALLIGGQAPANPDEPLASTDVALGVSAVLTSLPRLEKRRDGSLTGLFFGLGASVCATTTSSDVYVVAGLTPDVAAAKLVIFKWVEG